MCHCGYIPPTYTHRCRYKQHRYIHIYIHKKNSDWKMVQIILYLTEHRIAVGHCHIPCNRLTCQPKLAHNRLLCLFISETRVRFLGELYFISFLFFLLFLFFPLFFFFLYFFSPSSPPPPPPPPPTPLRL